MNIIKNPKIENIYKYYSLLEEESSQTIFTAAILDSVLRLELPSLLSLKHVYQTSVYCVLRLQVVLSNDLSIFFRGKLSFKCT